MYKDHDHRCVNQSVLEFIRQYNLGANNEPVTYCTFENQIVKCCQKSSPLATSAVHSMLAQITNLECINNLITVTRSTFGVTGLYL